MGSSAGISIPVDDMTSDSMHVGFSCAVAGMPVYLIETGCFKPPDELRVDVDEMEKHPEKLAKVMPFIDPNHHQEPLCFQIYLCI